MRLSEAGGHFHYSPALGEIDVLQRRRQKDSLVA
jgi:hypothetical protein